MGESPLFRVGDDVELWRMLLNFTVLALVVMGFEKALHMLEHRLEAYPKYHQMITKVYRELMILGVLGLGIKMLKEAGLVVETSPEMVAFVSADLTIFFLAVALILQAITIFLQLRMKNKQMDNLELIGSEDLLALAVAHERRRSIQPFASRVCSANKYDEEIRIRIFRNLFLKMHKLPEIFPFAKYLRQAQDNQITHMIDIELSMWLIVFVVAWSINASINILGNMTAFQFSEKELDDSNDSDDPKTKTELADAKNHYALAVVFASYSWLLLLMHLMILHFFERFLDTLLHRAGVRDKKKILERLEQVAVDEATNLASEVTAHAISRMEGVLETQQVQQHKRHHKFIKHDTGFQLLASCWRNCKGSDTHSHRPVSVPQQNQEDESDEDESEVRIRGYSRKAWHFTLKLFLILNGLYIALFVQTMVSHLASFVTAIGILPTLLIPLPLIVNWFVQTDLMRKFILISSLTKVHVETLGDVITDFTEAVQLQNSFISSVLGCLDGRGRSVQELEELFEAKDIMETGWIDVEDMRQILGAAIGFQMSFFKFNSVMRLLFQLRHLKVDYRKVVTLLTLAGEQHHEHGGHDGAGPHTLSAIVALHDLDHHHPHLQHIEHHHDGLLRDTTMCSEKTSFVIMEGGRGHASSFASSTAIMQDGLYRSSKLTRQMMGAASAAGSTTASRTTVGNSNTRRWGSSFHLRQPSLTAVAGSVATASGGSISSSGTARRGLLRAANSSSIDGGHHHGAHPPTQVAPFHSAAVAHSHFLVATLPEPSPMATPVLMASAVAPSHGYEANGTPQHQQRHDEAADSRYLRM